MNVASLQGAQQNCSEVFAEMKPQEWLNLMKKQIPRANGALGMTVLRVSSDAGEIELEQAEGGEGGEGAAAKGDAKDDAGENVAEEMHAEDDSRKRNAKCEENERELKVRIEIGEHDRDGRRSHSMA